jgi:hypothetical protein
MLLKKRRPEGWLYRRGGEKNFSVWSALPGKAIIIFIISNLSRLPATNAHHDRIYSSNFNQTPQVSEATPSQFLESSLR